MMRALLLPACLFALCGMCFAEPVIIHKPKLHNMDRINTAADEESPCPSFDGQQLLYSTTTKGEKALWLASRRSANEPLARDKPLEELTGEGQCCSPYLLGKDKDGWEFLYFATQYHTDAKKKNFDLYRVGRFNPLRPFQGYNAASPIQATATESDEIAPWVSADARTLYFSRKTEAGWQLMQCTAREPHAFEKSESAGLPAGYHHAVLSRTMLTMIVQGPIKEGETLQGLFFCKRKTLSDPWTEPKALNSINSEEGKTGTITPGLSSDNRFLYFASDRSGGKGGLDLYVVAVSEVDELKK